MPVITQLYPQQLKPVNDPISSSPAISSSATKHFSEAFKQIGNVVSLPDSYSEWIWKIGDNAFQLSASLIQNLQNRYDINNLNNIDNGESAILPNICQYLNPLESKQPVYNLLGPASVFYLFYGALSTLFGHNINSRATLGCQTLAAYLAGSSESLDEWPAVKLNAMNHPTWQSDSSMMNAVQQDAFLEICAHQHQDLLCQPPPTLGLPGMSPRYAAENPDRQYWQAAYSTALYHDTVENSPMNGCQKLAHLNHTASASSRGSAELHLLLNQQKSQALLAVVTAHHPLTINTQPDAKPTIYFPETHVLQQDDSVLTHLNSLDMARLEKNPLINNRPLSYWDAASSGLANMLSLPMANAQRMPMYNAPWRPNAPRKMVLTTERATDKNDYFYQLKETEEDGTQHALFSRPETLPDCQATLPEPPATVKAVTLLEMIVQLHDWIHQLSTKYIQHTVHEYISQQSRAWGIDIIDPNESSLRHSFIEILTCFELTLQRGVQEYTLTYSPEETQKFFTLLLADSPFKHNEELQSALIVSAIAEPLLGQLLFKVLSQLLPTGKALLEGGHQLMRYTIANREPPTFGALEGLMAEIQATFRTRLLETIRGSYANSEQFLTDHIVDRVVFWHQRLIEQAYPFMQLRYRTDLHSLGCLSRQGLLLSLGMMRLNSAVNTSTVTPKELSGLGQDLLLNSSIEGLIDEYSQWERLYALAGKESGRGIKYNAEQLMHEGVLVIRFMEAKRNLATLIKQPDAGEIVNTREYQVFMEAKQQLYALALESIPSHDQFRFQAALKTSAGIELQFVKLSDSRQASGYRPSVGFLLSVSDEGDNADEDSALYSALYSGRLHYFISLMPIQSDTTQALAFDLSRILPASTSAQQNYLNREGKVTFLERLSPQMAAEASFYNFVLESSGILNNQGVTRDWSQVADLLAREITARQFAEINASTPKPVETLSAVSSTTVSTARSWMASIFNQLLYLTPLGSCKDVVTDIENGQAAAMVLDGAFCIYAFVPAATEEEAGIKTVANVIKKGLKTLLEEDTEKVGAAARQPLLNALKNTLNKVEGLLTPAKLTVAQVKHCLTANENLKPLLLSPALYTSIALGEIPHAFNPTTVWRDPLHDVLYFVFQAGVNGQSVYRLDERNKLLLPNSTPSLLSMILREAKNIEIPILQDALQQGETRALRHEIYQRERMSGIEQYAQKTSWEQPVNGLMLEDNKPSGKVFYPAINFAGSENLYLLTLPNVAADQQIIVKSIEGRLKYWLDNAIMLKRILPSVIPFTFNDAYERLHSALENIPAGWTLQKIWIEDSEEQRIVTGWNDREGNMHYRQPNRQGKWLAWDSSHRNMFCQRLTRKKRTLPESSALVTDIFSPEHCGYLTVPRVTDPKRAVALEEMTRLFKRLPAPIIFSTLHCIKQAKAITIDFADLWDTTPEMIRKIVSDIRLSNIDPKNYNGFDTVTSKMIEYAEKINSDEGLSCEQKSHHMRLWEGIRNLLVDYKNLQDSTIEGKALKDEYTESMRHYYSRYIVRNLRVNHWINRWYDRLRSGNSAKSNYIIKATTPYEIEKNYHFLYQGLEQAISLLKNKALQLSTKLADKNTSAAFIDSTLETFFGERYTALQCSKFSAKLKAYLTKIFQFTLDDVVVVADRLSGKRLAAGCLNTPMEKIAFGDGAYSFVYNGHNDRNVYLFDYISNPDFIEYALAHELGHLSFNERSYVIQEEIYLKSGTVSKNYNLLGASNFASHLMSDRSFFLDYVSRNKSFAYAFYRHFKAHTSQVYHKQALKQFYDLMLNEDTSNSLYLHDKVLRKREMTRLVDMFFLNPTTRLEITYYNPDLFSGLFTHAYQKLLVLDNNNNKYKRSIESEQQLNSEKFFGALIVRFLHEKYIVSELG